MDERFKRLLRGFQHLNSLKDILKNIIPKMPGDEFLCGIIDENVIKEVNDMDKKKRLEDEKLLLEAYDDLFPQEKP